MQLRKIKLSHVKHFADFELDLVDPRTGRPRQWTLLVGKNGRGKSTLLQAIALASLGVNQANSVGQQLLPALRDARDALPGQGRDAKIVAEFDLPPVPRNGVRRETPGLTTQPRRPALRSELILRPDRNELTGRSSWDGDGSGDPLIEARSRALPWWLVAGYGVHRDLSTPERVLRPARPAEDRVAGLFRPHSLIGLGFTDLMEEIGRGAAFRTLMRRALVEHQDLIPDLSDVVLQGRGGLRTTAALLERRRFEMKLGTTTLRVPPTWLSHGYQASIAWIADLVGQYFLDVEGDVGTNPSTRHLGGLVLIDELDLFLHPEWQAQLIPALSRTFPNLQFIATTHSPILVSGCKRDEIVALDLNDLGEVTRRPVEYDPRLLTPGELFRQVLGLKDTPPGPLARSLDDYRVLARDPTRSAEEDVEMRKLRQLLQKEEVGPLPQPVPRSGG